jgi:predicted  nucleic acid-binding Zn-ribbon protein
MKTVTDVKGLSNLGTATTKRIRARPPQGGTAHLEMYLLSKEKQRLEEELAHLDQRRDRIHRRLDQIRDEITRLQQLAQEDENSEMSKGPGVEGTAKPSKSSGRQAQPRWKTIPLEY